MIKFTHWKRAIKLLLISLFSISWILAGTNSILNINDIPYHIVKEENSTSALDLPATISLTVLVEESPKLTPQKIRSLLKDIVDTYTSKHDVCALWVNLYDDPIDIGYDTFTLGHCTYFPGGDIANALYVDPGDYTAFQYDYTVIERDYDDRPSNSDIEIYRYYISKLKNLEIENDVADKVTMEKYGLTASELHSIFIKVYLYKHGTTIE